MQVGLERDGSAEREREQRWERVKGPKRTHLSKV